MTIWPYTSERSAEISGTLLDERTRTPVAGAEVFFTDYPKLHSKSGRDGRFKISATRNHHWITTYAAAGEGKASGPKWDPFITITHPNWATRQIHWDQSPQTLLLQKLPEPSDVRPWMTFDGNGVTLQDGGAGRYLAPRPILIRPYTDGMRRSTNIPNGALLMINVPFVQRVYNPHLTMLQGPDKPPFTATTAAGFSWSFWPGYDPTRVVNCTNDSSCVYRLEFIR